MQRHLGQDSRFNLGDPLEGVGFCYGSLVQAGRKPRTPTSLSPKPRTFRIPAKAKAAGFKAYRFRV